MRLLSARPFPGDRRASGLRCHMCPGNQERQQEVRDDIRNTWSQSEVTILLELPGASSLPEAWAAEATREKIMRTTTVITQYHLCPDPMRSVIPQQSFTH